MIKSPLFLKIFFILIGLSFSKSIRAQEINSYLFIQYEDNKCIELKLSKDFLIEHQSGFLEISDSSLENPFTIPIKTISLIGFVYKETYNEDAGIDSFFDNQSNNLWQIYDMEGRLIRESKSYTPDLKDLPLGKVFIIRNGSNSFKYIPCK